MNSSLTFIHRPGNQVHNCKMDYLSSLKKCTSAYLFQIAQEKSCDYLILIIYMKKLEMVKQKQYMRIPQSQEDCTIQGSHLIGYQYNNFTLISLFHFSAICLGLLTCSQPINMLKIFSCMLLIVRVRLLWASQNLL